MSLVTLEMWFWPVVVAIFGSLIGSFLNVVVYRRPLAQSVVWPGSHCPGCNRALSAPENIPVLSFAMQLGRCRGCAMPISWRYPANELATALIFLWVYLHFGPGIQAFFLFVLMALLIVTFWIDIDHMVILDEIMLPGIILGLIYSAVVTHGFLMALAGALMGACVLMLVNYVTLLLIGRDGIGEGDFLLMAMLGAWLGLSNVAVTLVLSVLVGSLAGLVLLFVRWFKQRVWLPFFSAWLVGIITYVGLYSVVMYWGNGINGSTVPGAGVGVTVWLGFALVSLFIGSASGWFLMRLTRDDGFLEMPFGPSLIAGGVGALFYGQDLSRWLSTLYQFR